MAATRYIVDHVEFEPKRAFRPLCPAHDGEWELHSISPKDDNHVTVIWREKKRNP